MSLFDLMTRAEAVLKKYEKYDGEQKTKQGKSDDPFMEEYLAIEQEIEKLNEAAQDVQLEHSRPVIAQKNGEIRRAKTVLMTSALEDLQKKVKKGKGVSKALIAEREAKIDELAERIAAIPDGRSSGVRKPYRAGAGKGTKKDPIILDITGGHPGHAAGHYDHTEETQAFEKDCEQRKAKQDAQIDRIGNVVDRLGEVAANMGEELKIQNPKIDEVDDQLNKVTGQLRNNNAKLKGLVNQMRNSRNFCVDVVLICILLAIGAYIYSMFK